jgi:5-(carboxyamino)imidazole ribonucleotide synthase
VSPAIAPDGPLAPGATIGILGGGQLGRMLALAAAKLGFRVHIYCDDAHAPAFHVAAAQTCAPYDDQEALARFAESVDVVTFEFENVPEATALSIADHAPVAPSPRALAIAQDRLAEKRFVSGLGIATAPFRAVDDEQTARAAFQELGGPAILKTRRLGYDGKGQKRVESADEAVRAHAAMGGVPAILERHVAFAFEASVVAARNRDGHFAAYDLPRNEHENHILKRSIVPAPLGFGHITEAMGIAQRIADALDYVGVLAVELFVGSDGALLVNEIAPRVHNSGHWTMEACLVSQFEQHIRAVAGWPLGDTARHCDAVMENIIGAEAHDWLARAGEPAGLHLYGKTEARPGRKMGHITRISPLGTLKVADH